MSAKKNKQKPSPESTTYEKYLWETICKSQDDFEKQLSFISAGSLGVSMIFIEKVVKNIATAHDKMYLIIGWVFLALTLFVNLLSHLLSASFNYYTLDEYKSGEADFPSKSRRRTNWMTAINWVTLAFLVIGIICIIIFSSINI